MASSIPASATPEAAFSPPSRLREFWRAYAQNRGAVVGLMLVALLLLLAVGADVIAPHPPNEQYREYTLAPPVWHDGGSARFLLGTDPVGRDIVSRLIHGTRLSLAIGTISVAISLTLGAILGLVAGYFRGAIDTAIMRLMDVMLALPSLLLAIAVVAILGPGLLTAMIAIGIVHVPGYARIVRGSVLTIKNEEYLHAALAPRIMVRHVLPNTLSAITVIAASHLGQMIIAESALSFIGLGVQPPTPSWGSMINRGREYITTAWWLTLYPGLALFGLILAVNVLGDAVRDVLDPRASRV